MTDIVERLRTRANDTFIRDHPLMAEAAAEIERLRADGVALADRWTATHEKLLSEFDKLRADNERHMREKVALAALVSKERDDNERLRQDNAEMRELINTLAEGRALEPKP